MGLMKEHLMREQEERERALNKDTTWEHSQHTDKFYENCSECSQEREDLDSHDCHLSGEDGCTCQKLRERLENTYECKICKDTGIVARTEWHEDDEREFSYEVEKRCICQED